MAPVSAAVLVTSDGGTNRNSGSLSMKRAMSQGQAIRSITGRSRVTHFMVTSLRWNPRYARRLKVTSVSFKLRLLYDRDLTTLEQRASISGDRWLMLVHQLPAKPAYLRVKVWRRLQALGAVAVKNSVYALPSSAEAQEDFEWLLREIQDGGGEAMVCEARLVDGMTDADVRALFDRARDADYSAITKEARELLQVL